MITIIPCQEVLKSVVDDNIVSSAAGVRRAAFDIATDLMSLGNIDVLLEGILFERIKPKLNPIHQIIFNGLYRVDNSAKDVTSYNIHTAIKWVAKSESNSRKVILISDNTSNFEDACNEKVKCFTPSGFLAMVDRAKKLHDSRYFSTLDDALMALVFMN